MRAVSSVPLTVTTNTTCSLSWFYTDIAQKYNNPQAGSNSMVERSVGPAERHPALLIRRKWSASASRPPGCLIILDNRYKNCGIQYTQQNLVQIMASINLPNLSSFMDGLSLQCTYNPCLPLHRQALGTSKKDRRAMTMPMMPLLLTPSPASKPPSRPSPLPSLRGRKAPSSPSSASPSS
jgi:hypothetical protein